MFCDAARGRRVTSGDSAAARAGRTESGVI
jgi:hypothetical protein